MTVEIISVGTELLLGNIINTNAAFLAEQCALLGLNCFYQTVVGDNEDRLEDTIKTALQRSDFVLLSGGLGPTQDDLTKEVAAKVCHRQMYLDEHSKQRIIVYFEKKNRKITENNWKQAMIPEHAIVIDNQNGTAPGIIIEENVKRLVLMPGPPNELRPMFLDDVVPYIRTFMPGIIYSETVKLCGVCESTVETQIKDLLNNKKNLTIAPYAKTGEVHLRVTAKAQNEEAAQKLVFPIVEQLKKRFAETVYTTQTDVTLEEAVVTLLEKFHMTVTTAESCTGGMIASRLMNVSGVSSVYRSGCITYANEAKEQILGVSQTTLDTYGAVSSQVASEMARGARVFSKADAAIAVTGLAGPDGATKQKPIGLVYISCAIGEEIATNEYHFYGNRGKIRESTTAEALTLLRKCILDKRG